MSKLTEKEIIKICRILCGNKNKKGKREYPLFANLQLQENYSKDEIAEAIEGLLDLYNNTKKSELILANKFQKVNIELNKEKEKNIQDMIKDFECSNFIKNNYIHKNKIETLLQDVDNTKFINKHVKGMYLYDNLKCLLEE